MPTHLIMRLAAIFVFLTSVTFAFQNCGSEFKSLQSSYSVSSSGFNPEILYIPSIQVGYLGEDVSISVFAVHPTAELIAYQWRKDGELLPEQNSSELYLTNLTAEDAGVYTVDVMGVLDEAVLGESRSSGTFLQIVEPPIAPVIPSIEFISSDLNLMASQNSVVYARVTGYPQPTYQWYKNDEPIEGAVYEYLPLWMANEEHEGVYHLVATNAAGSVLSDYVLVLVDNVEFAPRFVFSSNSRSIAVGQRLELTVHAVGVPDPVYAWFKDDVLIEDFNEATYVVEVVAEEDGGNYRVVATNDAGQAEVNIVITVVPEGVITDPPVIVTQPEPLIQVLRGMPVTMSVVAEGEGLQYQWFRNNNRIQGATNASYAIASPNNGSAATYTVRVSNPAGAVVSNGCVLEVE